MATQGCTAWYAARIAYPLRKGQRVLVHSAAGGVGQLLVQLALHAGCEVFAVAKGEEKMTHLRAMGAQHVIDRGKGPYAEAVSVALNGAKNAAYLAVAILAVADDELAAKLDSFRADTAAAIAKKDAAIAAEAAAL